MTYLQVQSLLWCFQNKLYCHEHGKIYAVQIANLKWNHFHFFHIHSSSLNTNHAVIQHQTFLTTDSIM
jgi:hypothetical protein